MEGSVKYENAKDVLPPELLAEVQKVAGGRLLYVPIAEEAKSWGTESGYRQKLLKRNQTIYNEYVAGKTVSELADEFFLSTDSIKKIVYGKKLLSVNREFYEINRVIGALYLLENNYEKALDSFEKAVEYAIAFDSYKDGDLYSSLIMYGIETDEHNLWDNSAVQDMLERLTKQSKYDVLKGNERYKTIVLNLEKAL